ncbi:MAG: ethanolamine ammonia-lyase subunit EutB [Lacunisphaera sp.]
MPTHRVTLRGSTHTFADLREVLAKASPLRSGDELAGVAAADAGERVAARYALADVPLTQFLAESPRSCRTKPTKSPASSSTPTTAPPSRPWRT